MIYDAVVVAGCAGLSVGRNIFQHDNVSKITYVLSKIVHEGITVDEALKILRDRKPPIIKIYKIYIRI